jgi:hypothetical protein
MVMTHAVRTVPKRRNCEGKVYLTLRIWSSELTGGKSSSESPSMDGLCKMKDSGGGEQKR